ncbi:glycosyltransferase [Aerococcaceae bacterium DSM 111021]|nr:glycosyltransferase [Aerococcaceae bacterium DSM 111021]
MSQKVNKRILHIMSSHGGGISTFIRNLATEIHRFGIVFDVVTYEQCPQEFVEAIQRTGGDVYQIKNPKKEGWKQFYKSFSRVIKLYNYDVIHCHISGYRALAYKSISTFKSDAEFIIHAHYYVDDNQLTVPKRFLHYLNQMINQTTSAKFVGCSRNAVQALFSYKIERKDMVIIPNSINPADFLMEPDEEISLREQGRAKYAIADDTLVVGQVGRLAPIKNHALMIQVAELVKMKKLNIKFLIAGSGELEEELQNRIKVNQLEDYVQLIGRVSPIADLFPVMNVLLFPSINEGLGTSAIESQAAGVPVVLSNTIPMEVELGIDLLYRVDLNATPNEWLKEILKASKNRSVESSDRLMALERNNYTNIQAAKLYASSIAEYTNY